MNVLRHFMPILTLCLALGLSSGLGGCATIRSFNSSLMAENTGPTTEKSDPWERFNRAMFGFNEVVDAAVVRPVAEVYRSLVPRWVRTSIDNVFGNVGDVWSTANLILQFKPRLALEMGIEVVLIDERDGRAAAKAVGLSPIGILGVLLQAKLLGQIDSLGVILDKLQNDAGFYINDRLVKNMLSEAGE